MYKNFNPIPYEAEPISLKIIISAHNLKYCFIYEPSLWTVNKNFCFIIGDYNKNISYSDAAIGGQTLLFVSHDILKNTIDYETEIIYTLLCKEICDPLAVAKKLSEIKENNEIERSDYLKTFIEQGYILPMQSVKDPEIIPLTKFQLGSGGFIMKTLNYLYYYLNGVNFLNTKMPCPGNIRKGE